LIPEIFDAVNMVVFLDKFLAVIDPEMSKFGHIQRIITRQSIRVDHAVRLYFLLDNRQQGFGFHVCDRQGIDFAAPFKQAKDNHFFKHDGHGILR